ncbi:MAG: hypothetical protein LBS50_03895 [Prevotellaceae bacterium]|jgi:hypothetical protein|nr:hypothetical protein [Prevotellaceae bacterium]
MNITGKTTGIKYKISLSENLQSVDFKQFNINECLVKDEGTDGDRYFLQ